MGNLVKETPLSEFMATMELLDSRGVTREDLASLRKDKEKARQVVLAMVKKVCQIYKVMMDYNLSLAEMIAAGNYGWASDDIIDKHFPIQGIGQQEVELVLVHLNRDATTKEVLEHLNSQGLAPAKIEHLLAFGAAYPDVQRELPIAALGSVLVNDVGFRRYPCLDCHGKRELGLDWNDDDSPWHGTCRFLALSK